VLYWQRNLRSSPCSLILAANSSRRKIIMRWCTWINAYMCISSDVATKQLIMYLNEENGRQIVLKDLVSPACLFISMTKLIRL
jgi:hypothetical protein